MILSLHHDFSKWLWNKDHVLWYLWVERRVNLWAINYWQLKECLEKCHHMLVFPLFPKPLILTTVSRRMWNMGLCLIKLLRLMLTRRPCGEGRDAGWMVGSWLGIRGSYEEECLDSTWMGSWLGYRMRGQQTAAEPANGYPSSAKFWFCLVETKGTVIPTIKWSLLDV